MTAFRTRCPYCNKEDIMVSRTERDIRSGDWAMCFHCEFPSRVDDRSGALQLRRVTAAEMDALYKNEEFRGMLHQIVDRARNVGVLAQ
jgi:hypothetical protein